MPPGRPPTLPASARPLPSVRSGGHIPSAVSHDALAPAGAQAARIAALLVAYLWIAGAVLAAVLVALAWAVRRRRTGSPAVDVELPPSSRRGAPSSRAVDPPDARRERRLAAWVWGATGATIAVLFGLLVASILTGRAVARFGGGDALRVRVTGHEWWWELEYGPDAADRVKTANELHVPVGRPVQLLLESADVIHSFWVPSLHGKTDLIPGKHNRITIEADRPGAYRGQCAEFCGPGHARMVIAVVAEDPAAFQAWLAGQRAPAAEPEAPEARRGRDVFLATSCASCHAIRGTAAGGTRGPDLSHLASRQSLAAGTLPRTRGHLGGWIENPQTLKPGTSMPPSRLPPADLQALLSYLEELR